MIMRRALDRRGRCSANKRLLCTVLQTAEGEIECPAKVQWARRTAVRMGSSWSVTYMSRSAPRQVRPVCVMCPLLVDLL
jgi:hypothetical protein